MALTWNAESNCHYQSHKGLWINFGKLRLPRIIWKICWWMCVCNASHSSGSFLYIILSLGNINSVSHFHFIDKETKSRWQIIWTGLWDSGPSFRVSGSWLFLLQWTCFQNHRTRILFESIFLVISKTQRNPQLPTTYLRVGFECSLSSLPPCLMSHLNNGQSKQRWYSNPNSLLFWKKFLGEHLPSTGMQLYMENIPKRFHSTAIFWASTLELALY